MLSEDDKSPPQDWSSYHAMFRGGVGGLIVLGSSRVSRNTSPLEQAS
jgi:hypothetical protein